LLASKFAIAGIKLLDVPSLRQGNVIEILPRGSMQSIQLEVVEACSGIRSLMTLVTLALLLGYFTRSGKKGNAEIFYKDFDFWRIAILMVSAVPIAIITNAARVTATGVLTYYYGRSAAEGFSHNVAGWLVYLAALLLLLALNWVLVFGYKRFSARKEAAA
jgi:exosortase